MNIVVFYFIAGSVNTIKRYKYETDPDPMVEVNIHSKRSCYICIESSDLQFGVFLNVIGNNIY